MLIQINIFTALILNKLIMKRNVGNLDRIIRIILGPIIGAAGIIFNSWLGLFGIIPIVIGLTGACGLYLPFGINTRNQKDDK